MNPALPIPISNLPEDGLRFFHSLSNWVEASKTTKPHVASWRKGQRLLKQLTCIKPKQGKQIVLPETMPDNTLYVPSNSHAYFILRQLRHAFCHNGIIYDETTKQYKLTDKTKITGQFTLEAIIEFTNVYLSTAITQN